MALSLQAPGNGQAPSPLSLSRPRPATRCSFRRSEPTPYVLIGAGAGRALAEQPAHCVGGATADPDSGEQRE
jgi:hypothetical protein